MTGGGRVQWQLTCAVAKAPQRPCRIHPCPSPDFGLAREVRSRPPYTGAGRCAGAHTLRWDGAQAGMRMPAERLFHSKTNALCLAFRPAYLLPGLQTTCPPAGTARPRCCCAPPPTPRPSTFSRCGGWLGARSCAEHVERAPADGVHCSGGGWARNVLTVASFSRLALMRRWGPSWQSSTRFARCSLAAPRWASGMGMPAAAMHALRGWASPWLCTVTVTARRPAAAHHHGPLTAALCIPSAPISPHSPMSCTRSAV